MNDPPHVFHLLTRLLKGGAEAKVLETVEGLEEYAFTVGHGAAYDDTQIERLHAAGIETTRFRTIRHYNPVTAVPAVLAVARHLDRHEYDIVHTHCTEAGIIGRFAAAIAGTPAVVHTVHGVPFTTDRNSALNHFTQACERLAARCTDRIVTNADVITAAYCDRGIGRPEQYTTVYSAIDVDRFRTATPAPDIDASGVRILMVGRLAEGKGFEDLLTAIDRLGRDDVAVYLVDEPADNPQSEAVAVLDRCLLALAREKFTLYVG
jgi:glycosyltransferase involved in cell wall biosynthesis